MRIELDPAPEMQKGFYELTWDCQRWQELSIIAEHLAEKFILSNMSKELKIFARRLKTITEKNPTGNITLRGHSSEEFIALTEASITCLQKNLFPVDLEKNVEVLKDFIKSTDRQLLETDEFHQMILRDYKDNINPVFRQIYENLNKAPWERDLPQSE